MTASDSKRMRVTLFVFLSLLLAPPSWAEPLMIVTESFPPYNYQEKGEASGLSTEVVQAVLAEIGIHTKINFYPWARAYRNASLKKNVLIYSIAKIPEREHLFQWVGAIAPYKTSLYKLRSNTSVRVNTLGDAKRYKIGVSLEDVIHTYLQSKGFSSFNIASKDILNIRMLVHGHLDLIAYDEASFAFEIKQAGLDSNLFERVIRLDELSDNLYMAFQLNSDPDLVHKFRDGLRAIKSKGIFNQIQAKYLLDDSQSQ